MTSNDMPVARLPNTVRSILCGLHPELTKELAWGTVKPRPPVQRLGQLLKEIAQQRREHNTVYMLPVVFFFLLITILYCIRLIPLCFVIIFYPTSLHYTHCTHYTTLHSLHYQGREGASLSVECDMHQYTELQSLWQAIATAYRESRLTVSEQSDIQAFCSEPGATPIPGSVAGRLYSLQRCVSLSSASVTPASVTPGSVTPASVTPASVTPGSVIPGFTRASNGTLNGKEVRDDSWLVSRALCRAEFLFDCVQPDIVRLLQVPTRANVSHVIEFLRVCSLTSPRQPSESLRQAYSYALWQLIKASPLFVKSLKTSVDVLETDACISNEMLAAAGAYMSLSLSPSCFLPLTLVPSVCLFRSLPLSLPLPLPLPLSLSLSLSPLSPSPPPLSLFRV